MGCELCYDLQYVIANSYLIPAGLSPNTNYYLWVYKPNSQVYSYQITTDSNGDIIIEASQFPTGFFNQYGGDYQVQVSSDQQGNNIVNMLFSVNAYQCVLINFLCCEQ